MLDGAGDGERDATNKKDHAAMSQLDTAHLSHQVTHLLVTSRRWMKRDKVNSHSLLPQYDGDADVRCVCVSPGTREV